MQSYLHSRIGRFAVLVALPALVAQTALTHLHAIEDSVVGTALVAEGACLGPANDAVDSEHARGECPLCVARAGSRATAPTAGPTLAVVLDHTLAAPDASLLPPAHASRRTPTLRGPPTVA